MADLRTKFAAVTLLIAVFAGVAQGDSSSETTLATREASVAAYAKSVRPLLAKHCARCHGETKQEGELSFAALNSDMKASTSAARWVVVMQKIALQEMPPEGNPRLSAEESTAIIGWIKAEMKRAGKHVAMRREYHNGNKLSHELLFDPKQTAPLDVSPRLRRVSPEIYARFIAEAGKGARGVSQPFSPSGNTTFADMGAPKLDEPLTAVLIRNALALVETQTSHTVVDGIAKKKGQVAKEYLRLFDTNNPASDDEIAKAISRQFEHVLKRQPTADERKRFVTLVKKNIADAGREAGVKYALAAVYLLPDAIFRWEIGIGPPDAQGRLRMAPHEIAYALSYALTDRRPEAWLLKAAENDSLKTQEGVAKAVKKLLADPKIDKTRIPRFFREYFGYAGATEVFKEQKENPAHDARALVEDTDRLIEDILERDKNVLYELLTTNRSFVGYKKADEVKRKRAEGLKKFLEQKRKNPEKFRNKVYKPFGRSVYESYNLTDFPEKQPTTLPASQRAGILTQPSWLVAFSKSDENHAILRGKWIRERLLGNVVPDIPITVDAQLPNAPHETLRQRMKVTQQEYCWKCHQLMNPVGLPFESYDYFGRHRTAESVLDREATAANVDQKGKSRGPVHRNATLDSTGRIDLTGDKRLQADVTDAVDMMHKIARSERAEQVFVRHVFRYFLGRNESLGDARTLQNAHKAYKDSGGSMKALIVSLLSSDSFLYRVPAASAGSKLKQATNGR